MADKNRDNRIDTLERSRDFHKDQKEMVVEYARNIVKENKHLKERNTQLINEHIKLKKTTWQARECDLQLLYKQIGGK